MYSDIRNIIFIRDDLVEGTTNFWYNPTPTPPTTDPINAPKTGIGIRIYPATADPKPIDVFTPICPIVLSLFLVETTLFENNLCSE